MKGEIKPLEAPACAYIIVINISMAVQMHDGLLATKKAGVVKRRKHSYFYLRAGHTSSCKIKAGGRGNLFPWYR